LYEILARKPEEKKSFGISKHRQNNIKIDLTKERGVWAGFIRLGPVADFLNVVMNIVFKHPAAPI
jgi:hypothetical protein